MTTQSRTSEWLLLAISVLPLVYLAAIWNGLPDRVPIHFGASGQPDGYAFKPAFASGMLVFVLLNYGLLRAVPKLDPTGSLMAASYDRVRFMLTSFMTGLAVVLLYIIQTNKTGAIVIDLILSTVFLLFAGMGNVMLNVPRNYFVGIRTPWTLNSEANWRKTHRFAGKLWAAGGILAFIGNLFTPVSLKIELILTVLMILVIIPIAYSYRLFKQGVTAVVLLLLAGLAGAHAQTQETITYTITQPAGASLTLEGTLTIPANVPGSSTPGASTPDKIPVVLLIAGSGPTDRDGNSPAMSGAGTLNMYRQLADSLTKRGLAVLRYDKRFSGKNLMMAATRLNLNDLSFDYIVADAVGIIRQLQADKRFSKVIVVGHSEGSLVGMLAATQTGAGGFVSIAGAGRNIADVMKKQFADGGMQGEPLALTSRQLDSLRAGRRVTPSGPMASFFSPANQPYLISWMKYDPVASLSAYKGPVLLIQGKHDVQVSVSEAERLKAARPGPEPPTQSAPASVPHRRTAQSDGTAGVQLLLIDGMNHVMKPGPADRAANIASYTAPNSTILPAVPDAIAAFVGK